MKDMFGDEIRPGERAPISLLPGPYPYGGFGWEGGPHEDFGTDVSMAWETSTRGLETVWMYFFENPPDEWTVLPKDER